MTENYVSKRQLAARDKVAIENNVFTNKRPSEVTSIFDASPNLRAAVEELAALVVALQSRIDELENK